MLYGGCVELVCSLWLLGFGLGFLNEGHNGDEGSYGGDLYLGRSQRYGVVQVLRGH